MKPAARRRDRPPISRVIKSWEESRRELLDDARNSRAVPLRGIERFTSRYACTQSEPVVVAVGVLVLLLQEKDEWLTDP